MNLNTKKRCLVLILLLQYSLTFYFLFHLKLNSDFPGFYWSAKLYATGVNPYQNIYQSVFSLPSLLPINLNPPFFLQSMTALTQLEYSTALLLWTMTSVAFGILGAVLSFYLGSTPTYFKRYWLVFLLMYLALFSTVIGAVMGQMGGFLLFFTMAGYYCFKHRYDYAAGMLWGSIAAVKLFPALLLIFVLNERRYRLFGVMLSVILITSALPLLDMGPQIYLSYFKVLDNVTWYQNNWNASVYGFISRLFIRDYHYSNLLAMKVTYLGCFVLLFMWYVKKIRQYKENTQQTFCMTLAMMLLLSPLGWQYYFCLLLLPLVYLWHQLIQHKILSNQVYVAWVLGFVLLNFPTGLYLGNEESLFYKLTYQSIYFYALICVLYLLCHVGGRLSSELLADAKTKQKLLLPVAISLALGLLATTGPLLINL